MKSKLYLFLVFLIGLVSTGFSQTTEYVINQKGDTIACNIKKGFLSPLKYKTEAMSEYEKLDPTQIKQYFWIKDKLPFRSVFLPKKEKPMFLMILEEGKITLFENLQTYNNGKTAYTSVDWYVAKGRDSLIHIKTNEIFSSKNRKERKEELQNLIDDNKFIFEKFNAADNYSFDFIRSIIKEYNDQAKKSG